MTEACLESSIMKSIARGPLTALVATAALAATVVAAAAQTAAPPPPTPAESPKWMQRWVDDRESMLAARLAGLKAGLKLNPDQEKLWAPFEAAVRDFAQSRMARMQGMMERMEKDEGEMGAPPSPIDRLDRMATRLSDVGAALRKIADAGKPLYASLDDQQRRMFGFLSREMMKMGRGHGGMDMGPPPRRHDDEDQNDSDDED